MSEEGCAEGFVPSDGDGPTNVVVKTEHPRPESLPEKSRTGVSGYSWIQSRSPEFLDGLQEKLSRLSKIVIDDAESDVDSSVMNCIKHLREELLECQFELDRVSKMLKLASFAPEDSIARDVCDLNTEFHYRSGWLSPSGVVKLVAEKIGTVSSNLCPNNTWTHGIQNLPVLRELVSKIFKDGVDIDAVASSILAKTALLPVDKTSVCLRSPRGPEYFVVLDSDLLNMDEISLLMIFCECLDINSSCGTYDTENEFQICHEIQDEFWNNEDIQWPYLPAMEAEDVPPRTVCWDVETSLDDLESFLKQDSPANNLLKEIRQELKEKLDQHHIDSAIKMHHISVVKNLLPELVKRKCQINSKLFALDGGLNIPDILHSVLKRYFPRVPKYLGEKAVFNLWKEAVRERRFLQAYYLGLDAGIDALPLTVRKILKEAAKVDWSAGNEEWRDLEKEKYALVLYPQITDNDPQAIRVLNHVCEELDLICEIL